jgi:hypothetical protein
VCSRPSETPRSPPRACPRLHDALQPLHRRRQSMVQPTHRRLLRPTTMTVMSQALVSHSSPLLPSELPTCRSRSGRRLNPSRCQEPSDKGGRRRLGRHGQLPCFWPRAKRPKGRKILAGPESHNGLSPVQQGPTAFSFQFNSNMVQTFENCSNSNEFDKNMKSVLLIEFNHNL